MIQVWWFRHMLAADIGETWTVFPPTVLVHDLKRIARPDWRELISPMWVIAALLSMTLSHWPSKSRMQTNIGLVRTACLRLNERWRFLLIALCMYLN